MIFVDDEPIEAGRRRRRTRSDVLFRRPSWPVISTEHRQSHRKSGIDLGMIPKRKCGVDMDHYASTEQLVVDMIDDHDREVSKCADVFCRKNASFIQLMKICIIMWVDKICTMDI